MITRQPANMQTALRRKKGFRSTTKRQRDGRRGGRDPSSAPGASRTLAIETSGGGCLRTVVSDHTASSRDADACGTRHGGIIARVVAAGYGKVDCENINLNEGRGGAVL